MRLRALTEMRTAAANGVSGRRRFLATTIGACAIARAIPASAQTAAKGSGSQTKEQRDGMTPGQVLDALKKGNERFRAGNMASRDYRDEQRTSAAGQYPSAVVLGCIDYVRRPRSSSTRASATRSTRGSRGTS